MKKNTHEKQGLVSSLHRQFRGGVASCVALYLSLTVPQLALADDQRYWLLQEDVQQVGQSCPEGSGCTPHLSYVVRGFPHGSQDLLAPLLDLLGPPVEGKADVPVFCAAGDSAARLGFDPESIPAAHKLAALRGITAVGLDLRKTKAPPGASADFGEILQSEFSARLETAGLRVVTPDEATQLPGGPTLNVYFSVNEGKGDCAYRYSIFASLSQTALLTRDLQTKLLVGVWSLSAETPEEDANGTEMASLLGVADAFVADFQEANSR